MECARAYDLEHTRRLLMQARLWLCDLLLWFAELCGGRVERAYKAQLLQDYHGLRRALLGALVMYAIRGQTPPQGVRVRGVPNAPPGFRWQGARGGELRAATRSVRLGGFSLRARFARLAAVMDRFDAHVARLRRKLLVAPQRQPVLVLAYAPVCTPGTCVAPAFANSS
jgi:hypothetical protein